MDIQRLEKIGLNRNEAIVYLALLECGTAPAGHLIRKTEFHRNIVYDNLEKLIDKGLVTYIEEESKRIFSIAPPEMMTEFLERKQQELDERKRTVHALQEEVRSYRAQSPEQGAQILRGAKGVRLVMTELLETGKEYVAFGAPPVSNAIMGEHFWKNFQAKQRERKITCKMIFNDSMRTWGKTIAHQHNTIRYTSNAHEPLTETVVFGAVTAIIVWSEKPIVTLIRDAHVAQSYRAFFEMLWTQARP